ncbi:hypothetical protein [Endozoicomonas sp. 4G]|uniref:hypothetical protein n=1 Tax=Endozoicomonas sp. 4G TaxID=2872754 RepID=UPI0020791E89|nr:hypothetical protein [Endozoicomonas sp. 4G]
MGKFSRDKGATGEREFIQLVDKLTHGQIQLKRNLDQCREGGDDFLGHDQFSIEVKRWRRFKDRDITDCWTQAANNAGRLNKLPVLAWRPDYQCWRVMIHPQLHFPLNDVRGCFSMDIELFCHLLTHPDFMKVKP